MTTKAQRADNLQTGTVHTNTRPLGKLPSPREYKLTDEMIDTLAKRIFGISPNASNKFFGIAIISQAKMFVKHAKLIREFYEE